MNLENNFKSLFIRLYGKEEAETCIKRLKNLFEKYQFKFESQADKRQGWTEEDAILITYCDVIKDKDKPEKISLELLEDFLDTYLNSAISSFHILSFFTSSSDK